MDFDHWLAWQKAVEMRQGGGMFSEFHNPPIDEAEVMQDIESMCLKVMGFAARDEYRGDVVPSEFVELDLISKDKKFRELVETSSRLAKKEKRLLNVVHRKKFQKRKLIEEEKRRRLEEEEIKQIIIKANEESI